MGLRWLLLILAAVQIGSTEIAKESYPPRFRIPAIDPLFLGVVIVERQSVVPKIEFC